MNDKQSNQIEDDDYYDTTFIDIPGGAPAKSEKTTIPVSDPKNNKSKKKHWWGWVAIALVVVLVFFTPFRINILLLGIDPTHNDTAQGRSDTMILSTIPPFSPFMHMLSIPRDLWVNVPGHGQNRINTAHFFAEIKEPGSGPAAAAETVSQNFNVPVKYTVRIKIDGFLNIVDAMGGVTVNLPFDMSGYKAGLHTLDSKQALALVRDRKGSDDFYRQMRQQIFLKAAFLKMINPINWWRIPGVIHAASQAITTNIPFYLWPRVGYSVLFSGIKGFDMQSLDHNMVQGYITDGGADVLLPKWDLINPFVDKIFK